MYILFDGDLSTTNSYSEAMSLFKDALQSDGKAKLYYADGIILRVHTGSSWAKATRADVATEVLQLADAIVSELTS